MSNSVRNIFTILNKLQMVIITHPKGNSNKCADGSAHGRQKKAHGRIKEALYMSYLNVKVDWNVDARVAQR